MIANTLLTIGGTCCAVGLLGMAREAYLKRTRIQALRDAAQAARTAQAVFGESRGEDANPASTDAYAFIKAQAEIGEKVFRQAERSLNIPRTWLPPVDPADTRYARMARRTERGKHPLYLHERLIHAIAIKMIK